MNERNTRVGLGALRRARRVGTALLLAMLTSCSALGPYADPREPRPGLVRGPDGAIVKDGTGNIQATGVSVGQAREYARLVQDAYREKIRCLSNTRLINNSTLIAIAASAIGMAATGGATEAIAALGIGGAGLGAIGSQLVVSTQRQIYAQGALALECVIGAASRSADTPTGNVRAEVALLELNAALAYAKAKIAAAREIEGTCSDPIVRAALVAKLTELSADVESRASYARQVRATLDALDPRGQILLSAVENIRWRVDEELVKSEPDLLAFDSALKTQLENASAGYRGSTAPAPQPPAASTERKNALAAVETQTCPQLDEAVDDANTAVSGAHGWVIATSAALAAAAPVQGYDAGLFENCSLTNPIGKGPLRAEPPEASVTPGTSSVLQTMVRGGRLPYSFDSTLPEGVTVDPGAAVPDGQIFSVKLTAAASKAPVVVLFHDGTGATAAYRVKAAKPAASATVASAPAAPPPDPRVKAVQDALGFPAPQVDGRWGSVTRTAVVSFVERNYSSLPAADRVEPEPDFATLTQDQLLTLAQKLLGLG